MVVLKTNRCRESIIRGIQKRNPPFSSQLPFLAGGG
jgi:hypothetical protein